MTAGFPHIKSEDYQRLFRLKGGLVYLLSDVFGGHYKNLDCLLMGVNGIWTSYLPRKVIEKTLQDGLTLLSSEKFFTQYVKDFQEYKDRSTIFFEVLLKKSQLTREEAVKSFTLISEMFSFYSKTEFFYTDRVYMKLKHNPSKELTHNIEIFEEIKGAGRQYLNQLIFSGGYADQLITLISKQFSVPIEQLKMYRVEEVPRLFDGEAVPEKLLNARAQVFVQYAQDGAMTYIEGEDAKKIVSRFIKESKKEKREIVGVVANKGKAIGKIKVISTDYYSDFSILTRLFDEMDDGDILVAETTSPELMPACKKAGAIITDQGGLLSHAAIVSRELNIPCIVGTGNATEILKDGNKVEVDAENGVVRIIS